MNAQYYLIMNIGMEAINLHFFSFNALKRNDWVDWAGMEALAAGREEPKGRAGSHFINSTNSIKQKSLFNFIVSLISFIIIRY